MANVTDNEERYLRQILLLGKGGCLVLRALLNREKVKDGRPLEDILNTSKTKLQKCLLKFQFNYIFPSATDVNADIETWDISLLISVIMTVFGYVSQVEKDALNEIRKIRNRIQGHHSSYALAEVEYNELRLETNENILKLAFDKTTKIECYKIISYSGAGQLTNGVVLKELNTLHAFERNQLSCLNERFGESKSKLECIGEAVNDVKTVVNTVRKNQHEHNEELANKMHDMHVTALSSQEDVARIKEKLNTSKRNDEDRHETLLHEIHMRSDESKRDMLKLKDIAARPKDLSEVDRNRMKNIEDIAARPKDLSEVDRNRMKNIEADQLRLSSMIREIMQIRTQRKRFSRELQTIIHTRCDHSEKQKSATELLYDFVRIIQKEDSFTEVEIMHMIQQRIQYYGEVTLLLLEDLIDWFTDMGGHPDASPGKAQLGSIRIPIICSSVDGLFSIISYMSSVKSHEHLLKISTTVGCLMGFSCSLSWTVEPWSRGKVLQALSGEEIPDETLNVTKIILPFQISSKEGYNDIRSMFGKGRRNEHIENISATLSQIFSEKISVTVSYDRHKWRRDYASALEDKPVYSFNTEERNTSPGTDDGGFLSTLRSIFSIDYASIPEDKPAQSFTKKERKTSPRIDTDSKAEIVDYASEPEDKPAHSFTKKEMKTSHKIDTDSKEEIVDDASKREDKALHSLNKKERKSSPRIGRLLLPARALESDSDYASTVEDKPFHSFTTWERKLSHRTGRLLLPARALESDSERLLSLSRAGESDSDEEERFERWRSLYRAEESDSDEEGNVGYASKLEDKPFHLFPTEERKTSPRTDFGATNIKKETVTLMDDQAYKKKIQHVNARKKQLKYKDANPKNYTPANTYSVMSYDDKQNPGLIAIEILPYDEILVADCCNRRLKKFDSSYKLVNSCELPEIPWDVCYVGDNTVLVSLVSNEMQFVNVSSGIKLEQRVTLNHYCNGLAYYRDKLYVTNYADRVYTYNRQLEQKLLFYNAKDARQGLGHIAVSDDGELIYITTLSSGLITINSKGELMSSLKRDILACVSDICVSADGIVLCYDQSSGFVLQVDYAGMEILQTGCKFTPEPHFKPKAICYDNHQSRLIVGSINKAIHVFD